MPLIKPRTHRVRTLRHICRLQEPNRDVLVAYARFIGETVDYVLNSLVDATLAKDRDFVMWRADQTPNTPREPNHSPGADPATSRAPERSR
jgi:hypothetical protein